MKLEFKERGSKNLYDEILFVATFYNKLLNDNKKKVEKLTTYMIRNIILCLICLPLVIYGYATIHGVFYIIAATIYILLLIYCIWYLTQCYKKIHEFMNMKGTIKLEINNKYVEYKDSNNTFKNNWEDIAFVLVSKYSICFVPKTKSNAIISLSVDNKEEIVKTLTKYDKMSLLIDNSKLYK